MSEKMSVHRGLAELKLLDTRIENAIQESKFCRVNKHSNKKILGMSIKEYEDKVIKSGVDKIESLIDRRKKIKAAIVQSNAMTEIEIAGKKMTVAEAIEYKNSIVYEEEYLVRMKQTYSDCVKLIEVNNSKLTQKADEQINMLYSDKNNIDPNKIDILRNTYIEENTYDFIDPVGIKDKIDKLEKEIGDFKTEVDFTLSESNATTLIEID